MMQGFGSDLSAPQAGGASSAGSASNGLSHTLAASLAGRAFTIRAASGRSITRQRVVRLTDDPRAPFWVLAGGR
jgi:hypothetical protein